MYWAQRIQQLKKKKRRSKVPTLRGRDRQLKTTRNHVWQPGPAIQRRSELPCCTVAVILASSQRLPSTVCSQPVTDRPVTSGQPCSWKMQDPSCRWLWLRDPQTALRNLPQTAQPSRTRPCTSAEVSWLAQPWLTLPLRSHVGSFPNVRE